MHYLVLADLTLLVHLLFVLFVTVGGLAVLRWHRLAWLHLPAVAWGIITEFRGWVCPLTCLENYFRHRGGEGSYRETCIEHYVMPILYPLGLTEHIQVFLGLLLLLINVTVYSLLWKLRTGTPSRRGEGPAHRRTE